VIIFSVLFSSCRKATEPPSSKLNFISTEVLPNVLIGYDSPTISVYKIDVNNDTIDDFQIGALWNETITNGHIRFGHTFSITSLDSNKVLGSTKPLEYPQNEVLKSNYLLDFTRRVWTNDFNFFFNAINTYVACQSDSSKYLGLMVKKMNQKYLGWIKLDWDLSNQVLKVKSFAITKKSDIIIYTGQLN